MSERCHHYPKVPLGHYPKKVEISQEEMHLAYLHRQATGEPIQSWIRRLIRENWHQYGLPLRAAGDQGGRSSAEPAPREAALGCQPSRCEAPPLRYGRSR